MYRIDAHHHFWRYDPAEYGWIGENMRLIQRNFFPLDLKKEIDTSGINGAISVQARQNLEETRWLVQHAEHHDFIKGVVGWVPLSHPDLERLLPTVAGHPNLRGVRHVLQDEPDGNYMLRDDFNRGIRSLKPYHLTYDILIFERHLPQTIRFVDCHPDQVFVLDHMGKPRAKDNMLSPWRENIMELAKRPHIYCKISGLVTEADWTRWTAETLRPYFDSVLEAFGPQRLMFGSDWPVCLVATTYEGWVQTVSTWIAELSQKEQSRIWSGTAVEAYRLSPS